VDDDLVRLGDLDRAGLGDEGLARQHVGILAVERALLGAAGIEHLTLDHAAAAGAAAPGHAAVGHRDLRSAQRLEKVRPRLDVDDLAQRLDHHFHGSASSSPPPHSPTAVWKYVVSPRVI
jgi:hypothetical protein